MLPPVCAHVAPLMFPPYCGVVPDSYVYDIPNLSVPKTGMVANYSHVFRRLSRYKPSTTMVPGHNAFPRKAISKLKRVDFMA